MPSLAGFFSRKNKSSPRSNGDTPTTSIYSNGTTDFNSAHSNSPTTEYVTPDRSLPSSPNGASNFQPSPARGEQTSSVYPSLAASSNKLRLPFTRKKASAATSSTSIATTSRGSHFGSPPMPSYMARDSMSAASDGEATDTRRLRPPPSKSAIFAAYGDPHSALSTRSLPSERPPSIEVTSAAPPVPPKKPGFFHWSKSSPSSPQATLRKSKAKDEVPVPPIDSSFNLKSFRHVRPPSPNDSDASLPLPIPRPRGNSTTSESSQRISVAAFREAQARRSTADSPIPSPRAPSPLSPQFLSGETNRVRPGPRPQQSLPTAISQGSRQTEQKNRSSGLAYTSDSDESSSEEDEDSDEPEQNGLTRRKHTITKRSNADMPATREPIKMRTTRSEAGHGSASYHTPPVRREIVPVPRSQSSHILMSQFPGPGEGVDRSAEAVPRSQSSQGFNAGGARPRATVSASAISPSAAAKRASIIAAANAGLGSKRTHTRHSSTQSIPPPAQPKSRRSSSSSSSDSEDDAPLATLLAPRRPGSAMSSASNNASRSNVNLAARSTTNLPKPLIDINELTRGRRPTIPQKDDGFTPGATLIGRGITNSPGPISPAAQADNSPIPTSKSPPTHFVSPPASPTKEHTEFISSQSSVQGSTRSMMRSISVLTNPLRREKSPEQKRDILTERLTRVVQLKAGGPAPASGPGPSFASTGKEFAKEQLRTQVIASSPPKAIASARSSGEVPVRSLRLSQPSPPEEDLASMLGAGISLISRNGESESDSDDSESEEDETDKEEAPTSITPIPIKQRAPPPAFSVTSRPQVPKNNSGAGVSSTSGTRQRSSTLASSTSSPLFSSPASNRSPSPVKHMLDSSKPSKELVSAMKPGNGGQRQRSSTMLPQAPMSSTSPSIGPMPSKPFAAGRRDSPASSTGDSSSGRAPFTPKDGSEVGSTAGSGIGRNGERDNGFKRDGWSGGVSGLPINGAKGVGKHIKRRSVSFEDDLRDNDPVAKERETRLEGEERRRERRRSEAKAAIELGNVINGRGPVVEDDDDDLPINQTLGGGRMSAVNPMMTMGGPMPMQMGFGGSPAMNPGFMGGWPQQPNPQLLSPAQFMPQAPDPNFMAAHQQAMMYAKHAYQMAVAQQAMAAAGDEWERGSTVGGFGGGSVYGGASPSVMGSPYGMGMGMGGMGMQSPSNGWSTGSVVFPPSARPMYGGGISGARSDYGGGGGGGGARWTSSRSSYGENFGPPDRSSKASAGQSRSVYGQRDSGYFPPVPPIPQNTGSPAGRGSPRSRTTSQPASPGRSSGGGAGVRRAPPPSSWKAGV